MADSSVQPRQIRQTTRSSDILPGVPIQRPDLVALVTGSLRQQILDGTYPPGSFLPAQGKLAEAFKVSVNVIREAMRNLRSLGMVEVSQGRYPQVRGINPEASINAFSIMLSHANGSLYHLMEARVPLEIHVATLAAERATPEDVARCEQALADMRASRNPEEGTRGDQAFHRGLAMATGNPLLLVMVDTLAGLQVHLTREAFTRMGIKESSIAEHEAILEAVRNHDEKAAGQLMLRHLEAVLDRMPRDMDPTAPLAQSAFEEYRSSVLSEGDLPRESG